MAREQRKLAAILAADVVGYFRLMGRDESGTLAHLQVVVTKRDLSPTGGANINARRLEAPRSSE